MYDEIAAADPDVVTPAVIPTNAGHWNLADRPPTPRLTPATRGWAIPSNRLYSFQMKAR